MYNLEKKNQHYNKNTPGNCGRFKSIPNVHISIKKQKVVPKKKMKPLFLCCNIVLLHYRYTKVADKLVGTSITRFAMKRPLI